jgi:hypothetical protein
VFERLPNWRRFLIAEVVMMAERIEGPAFMTFTCQCGGRIQALPSAEVRCKCGRAMMRKKIHRDERKPTVQSLFEALKNK